MDRFHEILKNISEAAENAQKTYKGQKRSELKDSDFLFPQTRSFPIVTPTDVPDAISNFGRMKGNMSYEAFLRKLYNLCKRKGPEFIAALPQASKDKLGIKATIIPTPVVQVEPLSNDPKPVIKPELVDQKLKQEQEKLAKDRLKNNTPESVADIFNPFDSIDQTDLNMQDRNPETDMYFESPEAETETTVDESTEYKNELYEMSLSSLKAIKAHVGGVLNAIEENKSYVKENLTEPWLQGKIAITEDYIRTIHDFIMFSEELDDTSNVTDASKKK